MAPRLDLQNILEELLGSDKVYFQPPTNVQMQYPCIVYKRDNASTAFADDSPYRFTQRYQVTIIDRNPDSPIVAMVAALRLTRFARHFTADNLNHDVFELYF